MFEIKFYSFLKEEELSVIFFTTLKSSLEGHYSELCF